MNVQVWILLIVFIIQILYSIFASMFSREYREICFKNKVVMGIYYFMTIIVLAILLMYGTHCSIVGKNVDNSCELYSWLLTTLVVVMILFTIIRSIILIVKEKKDKTRK